MEERKLATIRKIKEIKSIEGADNIILAFVDGWQVIVRKDEDFKEEDLAIYLEVDSFLPIHSEFEFLRKSSYKKLIDGTEGFRLRTQKLRGVLSQGLLLSLDTIKINPDYLWLKYFDATQNETGKFFIQHQIDKNCIDLEEGVDVTEILGITKYDADSQVSFSGNAKGSFPSFLKKSDEVRIQNIPNIIEEYKDELFYITEKIDGTSFTCYYKDEQFGVCSRNLELKEEIVEGGDYDRYWKIAKKYDLENKLKSLAFSCSLQGELIGPGIQKNPYKLKEQEVRFFTGFNIDTQEFLDWNSFSSLIRHLDLQIVPLLGFSVLSTFVHEKTLMESLIWYADGKSMFGNMKREGVVFRSKYEKTGLRVTTHGRLSFKIVSNDYLLKEKD